MTILTEGYPVIITHEEGWFTVQCPIIPGCISQGRTRELALANIREAIALCLESQEEEGWSIPEFELERVAV